MKTEKRQSIIKILLLMTLSLLLFTTCQKIHINPYDPKSVAEGYVTPMPEITTEEGIYRKDIGVSISCSDEEAEIYYTLDGTSPDADSALYTGPISIGGDGTNIVVKAVSQTPGKNLSGVKTASYTIQYLDLEVLASGNGTVSPSGSLRVPLDGSVTVTGTPGSAYAFSHWSAEEGSGITIADIHAESTTVTLTDTGGTVVGTFDTGLSLTVSDDGNGTTTPAGDILVVQGIPRTISASPAIGYRFDEWSIISGSGATIADSTLATTTVTLNSSGVEVQAGFALLTYQLTASAGTGGSVTPASPATVNHGVATAITATPASGYMFDGWSILSGSGASIADTESATTTVTLTDGDAEVMASFRILRTLTMANDGNGSTTPAAGAHQVGDGLTQAITATPNTGYGFSHWSMTGSAEVANAYNPSTTVTLSGGNGTVTANFTNNTYDLTVTGGGNGTVDPSGTMSVIHGVSTPVNAIPDTANGFEFDSWTVIDGTAVIANSSSASTTVTLTSGAATIQANFVLKTYTLTVTDDGYGTASPSGGTVVTHGVARTISATPDTGYNFDSWSVVSGTADIANTAYAATTVTLTSGDATIRANFTPKEYSLTITDDENGTTEPSGTITVDHAAETAISATPEAGHAFDSWSVISGTGVSFDDETAASTTVTLTGGDAVIQANFISSFTLTVTDDGHGSTVPAGDSTVNYGDETSISATPGTGYNFSHWSVESGSADIDDTLSASTTVILTEGAATVQANFTLKEYSLLVTSDGNGTVTPTETQTVSHGVATDISATADDENGYEFSSWSVAGGTGVSFGDDTAASTTVILTGGDATIQANFALKTYTLTLTTDGNGSTSPSGSTTVTHGVEASISAIPNEDYYFTEWTTGDSDVSFTNYLSESTTVTLTGGDATINASFDSWATADAVKLLSSDGQSGDHFGCGISASGSYAVIGADGVYNNYVKTGSAYIFHNDGTSWTQQEKLTPDDGAADDSFGNSVSISGAFGVIGASGDDNYGDRSGSAYVFYNDGTSWTQQTKLTASDGGVLHGFGTSVSIDGNYALIGAPQPDGVSTGAAYMFYYNGTEWEQQIKLIADDGVASDSFGISVSISGDYAVIGARDNNDGNGYGSGSAYVFYNNGTSWVQQAKLSADDGAMDDCFGTSVSISGDIIVVGSPYDDDEGTSSGSIYIFRRDGTSWTQEAKLTADDGADSDILGASVSISGSYIVAGAYGDDDNGSSSGSAYVFYYDGSDWSQQSKLIAPDDDEGDQFGRPVFISGGTVLCSALYDDENGSSGGSVYVFEVE